MRAQPTLAIPKDLIEPIIQANITAAVAQAIAPNGQMLQQAVATILSTRVDQNGTPTNSSYQTSTWLDWAVGNAIRAAAKAAITEQVQALESAVKAHIARELQKKNSPLVKQIADGMIGAAFSPDGLRYRLTVAVDKA